MTSGLLSLLDDAAAIAKAAASSLDDVATQAIKASGKAAGVVIDDAAVTPRYVVGLSPAREIPIVWNIAKGSLRNKLLILTPALLLLGVAAPWSIAPLLAVGGVFLCFEGYEKLHSIVHGFFHGDPGTESEALEAMTPEDPEAMRTKGAIRTDFILSAEIMAIAYDVVHHEDVVTKFASLVVVAVVITAAVYGFVALILKVDDLGLSLCQPRFHRSLAVLGRLLITVVPGLLVSLSYVGTAAMLWVGGGIVIHSIPPAHHAVDDLLSRWELTGFAAWSAQAVISLTLGIAIGFVVVRIVAAVKRRLAI